MHIGGIVQDMRDSNLKYGFLSTYNQTIFLRQVVVDQSWTLEYSPVVYHDDEWSTTRSQMSLCQSFYHVGLLALADSEFGTAVGLQNQKWTAFSVE